MQWILTKNWKKKKPLVQPNRLYAGYQAMQGWFPPKFWANSPLTGLCSLAAAPACPLLLSSDFQRTCGAWTNLCPPGSHWTAHVRGWSLRPHFPVCSHHTSRCIWGSLSLLFLLTGTDYPFHFHTRVHCRHRCVPGFIGGSPVNISLSLKSVGVYFGFCQNQRRLRSTTTVSTEMVSFGLDTGISDPPTSTSSTKFRVAAANMSWLDASRLAKFKNENKWCIHTVSLYLTVSM